MANNGTAPLSKHTQQRTESIPVPGFRQCGLDPARADEEILTLITLPSKTGPVPGLRPLRFSRTEVRECK